MYISKEIKLSYYFDADYRIVAVLSQAEAIFNLLALQLSAHNVELSGCMG